jgi:hypothetical protein
MVSPPTTQRNASRTQSEGRAGKAGKASKKRGQGQYKGRSLKAPAQRRMVGVFYSPSSSSKRLEYSTRRCPRWWHLHQLWGGAIGYPRSGGRARARTRRPRHQGRARTQQRGQGTPSRPCRRGGARRGRRRRVGEMRIMILSGWVRWVRGRLFHVNTSCVLAAPPGD